MDLFAIGRFCLYFKVTDIAFNMHIWGFISISYLTSTSMKADLVIAAKQKICSYCYNVIMGSIPRKFNN